MKFLLISTIVLALSCNVCINAKNLNTPTTPDKLEEFLEDYSSNISQEERDELLKIKDKMDVYDALTQEDVDFIRECEINAFKNKLGEAKYEEYRKLVEKMESDAEFTQPERYRLYELLKELKSK